MSSGGHNRIKSTVESAKCIDIRFLQNKVNFFRLGRRYEKAISYDCEWSNRGRNAGSARIKYLGRDYIGIYYTITSNGQDVGQLVKLDYIKTNYGERAYIICPECEKRTTALFFRGSFKCRKCARLNYYSSQMNHDLYTRTDKKIETILKKLKYKYDNICDVRYVPRPKLMRKYTYEKLIRELKYWQDRRIDVFIMGAQKILEGRGLYYG